jgi:hypothetical protein
MHQVAHLFFAYRAEYFFCYFLTSLTLQLLQTPHEESLGTDGAARPDMRRNSFPASDTITGGELHIYQFDTATMCQPVIWIFTDKTVHMRVTGTRSS